MSRLWWGIFGAAALTGLAAAPVQAQSGSLNDQLGEFRSSPHGLNDRLGGPERPQSGSEARGNPSSGPAAPADTATRPGASSPGATGAQARTPNR